jgi:hypothetical protein
VDLPEHELDRKIELHLLRGDVGHLQVHAAAALDLHHDDREGRVG